MAWIESHQTLEKHGKLLEAASLLGIQKHQLIGHLHCLWWWIIDSAPTGNISKYSPITIAEAAGWFDHVAWWHIRLENAWNDSDKISAGRFVAVLIDCGFIDRDAGSKNIQDGGSLGENARVHDWLDFCGDLVKKRLERKTITSNESNELRQLIEDKKSNQKTGNKNPHIEGIKVPSTVPYRTVPKVLRTSLKNKKGVVKGETVDNSDGSYPNPQKSFDLICRHSGKLRPRIQRDGPDHRDLQALLRVLAEVPVNYVREKVKALHKTDLMNYYTDSLWRGWQDDQHRIHEEEMKI